MKTKTFLFVILSFMITSCTLLGVAVATPAGGVALGGAMSAFYGLTHDCE